MRLGSEARGSAPSPRLPSCSVPRCLSSVTQSARSGDGSPWTRGDSSAQLRPSHEESHFAQLPQRVFSATGCTVGAPRPSVVDGVVEVWSQVFSESHQLTPTSSEGLLHWGIYFTPTERAGKRR